MQEGQISKFIEWLSYKPSGSEICRALVTEYTNNVVPYSARISRLNDDDSLTIIGEYGFEAGEAELGKRLPSQEWRNRKPVLEVFANGSAFPNWTSDRKMAVFSLRDRGAIQGFIAFRFLIPLDEKLRIEIEENLATLLLPLSLYLSLLNQLQNPGPIKNLSSTDPNISIGSVRLTQRQLQILRGMVEGKTNHDLATDLGYSVSTIRHETMAIYRELSVSDRKEAARIAISKGLVS